MLVDIIPLRHQGRSRPREDLTRAVPLRGFLVVTAGGMADLHDPQTAFTRHLLPSLRETRLHTLRESGFVLHGVEAFPAVIYRGPADGWPQAWWCRVVLPHTPASVASDRRDPLAGQGTGHWPAV